jgi:hypothetical protein
MREVTKVRAFVGVVDKYTFSGAQAAWPIAFGIACHSQLSTRTRCYGGGASARGGSSSATARV